MLDRDLFVEAMAETTPAIAAARLDRAELVDDLADLFSQPEMRSFWDSWWAKVCRHTMTRATGKVREELDARLRNEAKRRGATISEVTREALEAHLGVGRSRRRLRAGGSFHSGQGDLSSRIEEILAADAREGRW